MTGVAGKAKTVVEEPDLLAMSLSNASVASFLILAGRIEPILPAFRDASELLTRRSSANEDGCSRDLYST
jgi:hypothetical protein